jgi:hypothetical protein
MSLRFRSVLVLVGVVGGGAGVYGLACVNSAPVDLTCPTYCNQIAAICTGTAAQYPTADNGVTCNNVCDGGMPPGQPNQGGVNSVNCRNMFLSNAKEDTDPNQLYSDCMGAGISSPSCPSDPCTAFCNVDIALCGTVMTGYTNGVTDCVAAC